MLLKYISFFLLGFLLAEIIVKLLEPQLILRLKGKEYHIHHLYSVFLIPLFIDKLTIVSTLMGIAIHDLLIELKKRFKKKKILS